LGREEPRIDVSLLLLLFILLSFVLPSLLGNAATQLRPERYWGNTFWKRVPRTLRETGTTGFRQGKVGETVGRQGIVGGVGLRVNGL
jgi:hypothetical protein